MEPRPCGADDGDPRSRSSTSSSSSSSRKSVSMPTSSTDNACFMCKTTEGDITERSTAGGQLACKNCWQTFNRLCEMDDKDNIGPKCKKIQKCNILRKPKKMHKNIRGRHALCNFCKWDIFKNRGWVPEYQCPSKKPEVEKRMLPSADCITFDSATNKWEIDVSKLCKDLNDLVVKFNDKKFHCFRSDPAESKKLLLNHLEQMNGAYKEHKIADRWMNAMSGTDLSFFDEFEYMGTCRCGDSSVSIHHSVYDFFLRIGWIGELAEEKASNWEKCSQGRGMNANGVGGLINSYKISPYPVRLDVLRKIAKQLNCTNFEDPTDDCEHCGKEMVSVAPHILSTLLENFGLAEGMRKYASHTCKGKDEGMLIRYRDLLDFLVYSRKFTVYGPTADKFPPNIHSHSMSKEIVGKCYSFLPIADLDENTLCFAFCRRQNASDTLPTKGIAMYFGTKRQCFACMGTYSESMFYHWYFVPIAWHNAKFYAD